MPLPDVTNSKGYSGNLVLHLHRLPLGTSPLIVTVTVGLKVNKSKTMSYRFRNLDGTVRSGATTARG